MIVFQTPASKTAVFDYYMSVVDWKPLTSNVQFSINKDVFLLLIDNCILKFRTSYVSNISTLDGIMNFEFQDYFGDYLSIDMQCILDALDSYSVYWSIRIYDFHQYIWDDCLQKYMLFMIDDSSVRESSIYCSWMHSKFNKEEINE